MWRDFVVVLTGVREAALTFQGRRPRMLSLLRGKEPSNPKRQWPLIEKHISRKIQGGQVSFLISLLASVLKEMPVPQSGEPVPPLQLNDTHQPSTLPLH